MNASWCKMMNLFSFLLTKFFFLCLMNSFVFIFCVSFFNMIKFSHLNNNKEEEIKLNYTVNKHPLSKVRILSLHEKCGNLNE